MIPLARSLESLEIVSPSGTEHSNHQSMEDFRSTDRTPTQQKNPELPAHEQFLFYFLSRREKKLREKKADSAHHHRLPLASESQSTRAEGGGKNLNTPRVDFKASIRTDISFAI